MADKENDFIGIADTAKLLMVCEMTLRRWIKQGKVPYYQVGRKYLFSKKELLQFLERHHTKGTPA